MKIQVARAKPALEPSMLCARRVPRAMSLVRSEVRLPLLRFLVVRVLSAELAELLHAHAVGVCPLVLRERVVPALAAAAGERDDVAHGLVLDLRDHTRPHRPAPLPDRKPQLLLHRD